MENKLARGIWEDILLSDVPAFGRAQWLPT
jgi:hypothetical protein